MGVAAAFAKLFGPNWNLIVSLLKSRMNIVGQKRGAVVLSMYKLF